MSKGYVYILGNAAMPGLYKIGKTTRSVEARASELFQTGVPHPFDILHFVYSPDCHQLEADMHAIFAANRVDLAREFFEVDLPIARRQMDSLLGEQVNALVEEFMPDHAAVQSDMLVDEAVICRIAYELGEHPFFIASALNEILPEELAPAIERARDRLKRYRAAAQ